MLGLGSNLPRAFALGAAMASLAACATAPAPILRPGALPQSPSPAAQPPFDPASPPRVADAAARQQCVPFARNASGVQIFGDANTWWAQAEGRYPRSHTPAPGAVLVTRGYRDPSRGHVAVVVAIVSDRIVRVDHANWLNGGEISVGVPVLDVSPSNDWSQVRVWNIPSASWGVRIYEAEGFIHPLILQASLR